jgi:hypothetical protein
MSIYSWFVSSVPKKMAKASTHVKQIFMNGRSGRDCCGAVTTSARRPNTKPGLIWRSAAAQRRARGASHPAQKRSERIGRRFEIANPPVPRRRLLLSSGTVTRCCCCCALRRRSLAGPDNLAAHRRSNLLSRSRGIPLITKAPGLLSPPGLRRQRARAFKGPSKRRLEESARAHHALGWVRPAPIPARNFRTHQHASQGRGGAVSCRAWRLPTELRGSRATRRRCLQEFDESESWEGFRSDS